jgi:general secretion pathway protein E
MIARPHGIVLVTGPTGSGKTTTLYTTLKQLAVPEVNVCTVEDPIEMVVPELNQMQVQPAIDLTFAQGIRTLLRQDPTSSWSAKSAIWKPRRWRCRRR